MINKSVFRLLVFFLFAANGVDAQHHQKINDSTVYGEGLTRQSADMFVNGSFDEYVIWKDERGEVINAHDGGVLFVDGVYYWYGLALRAMGRDTSVNNGAATTTGVNLYSSVNLHQWKYEGVILSTSNDPAHPLFGPMRMERPKIIYNPRTKKYVMWFHYVGYPGTHKQGAGYADAGVAWADKITGPFHFVGYHRPINDSGAVKDCTLFLDTDTIAYFLYDRKMGDGSRCLHVVKLSDDFLQSTDQWAKIDIAFRREAPVLIKKNGMYYLVTSDVSGWKANAAKIFIAKNIFGPWADIGNPCVGEQSETTFHSQPTAAFDVKGLDQSIIMLERHNTENFIKCSYIWLPIQFDKNQQPFLKYETEWRLGNKK